MRLLVQRLISTILMNDSSETSTPQLSDESVGRKGSPPTNTDLRRTTAEAIATALNIPSAEDNSACSLMQRLIHTNVDRSEEKLVGLGDALGYMHRERSTGYMGDILLRLPQECQGIILNPQQQRRFTLMLHTLLRDRDGHVLQSLNETDVGDAVLALSGLLDGMQRENTIETEQS